MKITIGIFVFQYGLTLGPVTWIYLSEILLIKQMSIAVFCNWMTNFAVVSLLPMLNLNSNGG